MKGFPGVSLSKVRYTARRGCYEGLEITYPYYKARIMVDGRSRILGYYQTKEEAAAAYRKAKDAAMTETPEERNGQPPGNDAMSRTPLDPDEIAATVEPRRIQRLRDEQDVMDLAAMLVTAFKASHMQIEIADALRQRRLELKLRTWNPDGEEAYE